MGGSRGARAHARSSAGASFFFLFEYKWLLFSSTGEGTGEESGDSAPPLLAGCLSLSRSELNVKCDLNCRFLHWSTACVKREGGVAGGGEAGGGCWFQLLTRNGARFLVIWRTDTPPVFLLNYPPLPPLTKKILVRNKNGGLIAPRHVQYGLSRQQERVGLRPRHMIGDIRPFSPTLRCLSRSVDHGAEEAGRRGERPGEMRRGFGVAAG